MNPETLIKIENETIKIENDNLVNALSQAEHIFYGTNEPISITIKNPICV